MSSLAVYLIQPAWCCQEHSHAAEEVILVRPGEPSAELALAVPVPEVSKLVPSPNFPRYHELQESLLAVGRAA